MTGRGGFGSLTIDSLADVLERRAKYFRVSIVKFELCRLDRTERAVVGVPTALQDESQHAVTRNVAAEFHILVVAIFVDWLAVLRPRSERVGEIDIG